MLQFAEPLWLIIGSVFPLWAYLRRRQMPHFAALRHPFSHLVPAANIPQRTHPYLGWFSALTLAVFALAQPQWSSDWTVRPQQQRDIMIALDVSASMRALDFTWDNQVVSRLTATKHMLRHLFRARTGDHFGIQIFGNDSFLLAPPTDDTQLLTELIDEIQPGIAGEKTALGDALMGAINRLGEKAPTRKKVLILFSDGTQTSGRLHPSKALAQARAYNVRVFAIGIGRDGSVPFPGAVTEPPKLVQLPINEPLLRDLAAQTDGLYVRAQSTADLLGLVDRLAELEPQSTLRIAQTSTPLFWLPLLAALAVGLGTFASARWHTVPVPPP